MTPNFAENVFLRDLCFLPSIPSWESFFLKNSLKKANSVYHRVLKFIVFYLIPSDHLFSGDDFNELYLYNSWGQRFKGNLARLSRFLTFWWWYGRFIILCISLGDRFFRGLSVSLCDFGWFSLLRNIWSTCAHNWSYLDLNKTKMTIFISSVAHECYEHLSKLMERCTKKTDRRNKILCNAAQLSGQTRLTDKMFI